MPSQRATLTFRVSRTEGVFLATCEALDVCTQADSIEELPALVVELLQNHFKVARDFGVFEREVAKIGLGTASGDELQIHLLLAIDEQDISIHVNRAA